MAIWFVPMVREQGCTGYTKAAQAAETAADGGSFVICTSSASEPCQLFARGCSSDDECQAILPGTVCKLDAAEQGGEPYCHAPGEARDDRFRVGVNGQDVSLDVLANDVRSESACRQPTGPSVRRGKNLPEERYSCCPAAWGLVLSA